MSAGRRRGLDFITRFGGMWRVVVAAAVLLVLPTYAFAAAPVIAVLAEGPDAASVRQALVDLVPKGVTTADAGAFQASLAHTGQKGPIGKQIEGGGRAKAVKRLTEAAKDVGAVAVLLGRVTRTKKARKVNLIIVEASGEVPLDADVDLGSKPDSADGAALDAALAGALQKYAPADKAETKPAGKDAPKEEAKKEDSDEGKEAEGAPPPESAKDTSPWQFRARPLIDSRGHGRGRGSALWIQRRGLDQPSHVLALSGALDQRARANLSPRAHGRRARRHRHHRRLLRSPVRLFDGRHDHPQHELLWLRRWLARPDASVGRYGAPARCVRVLCVHDLRLRQRRGPRGHPPQRDLQLDPGPRSTGACRSATSRSSPTWASGFRSPRPG